MWMHAKNMVRVPFDLYRLEAEYASQYLEAAWEPFTAADRTVFKLVQESPRGIVSSAVINGVSVHLGYRCAPE